jgi:lipopolysaccharide/colanic/teichoic acid biosynthesis glycosyltransferase
MSNFAKEFFDLLFSFVLLMLCMPLIILISISIFFFQGGEIIFTQERSGKNNKKFTLYKFKTMKDLFNDKKVLLPDQERVTYIGSFLRKTSLDELPSLINVLTRDMSLVGPRPLPLRYAPLYDDHQIKRLLLKPGITGWAQINGRNAISWQKKFDLDVWYVENRSMALDLKIIFLTLKKVIYRENINHSTSETMPEFLGNNNE